MIRMDTRCPPVRATGIGEEGGKMPAKTRTQPFDPSAVFALEDEKERLEALRSKVLPRLIALKDAAVHEANYTYDFDAEQASDELTRVTADSVEVGLHPADGDYSGLRGVRQPAIELKYSATADGLGLVFHVGGAAEWRLFIKALYQHREQFGEYI